MVLCTEIILIISSKGQVINEIPSVSNQELIEKQNTLIKRHQKKEFSRKLNQIFQNKDYII